MAIILCLLMAILTSCQSQHERQVQMLNDLLEATDNYEVMPNDSDARAVLYYMERHGSPRELQQAWRMMAKMYRRHGALMYEGFAYEMAADCVDSLSADFDPRALAEICYEWSINQQFSFDDELAKQTARRGMELAQQAGDTLLYYRCMGREADVALTVNRDEYFMPTAYQAFSELWKRGRKDWAVDAFIPYLSFLLNDDRKDANLPDSMTMWMQRYERFTREDLEHVGSYAAIQHWELRGDYHLRLGDFDSAHYYYMKLDHPWNYVHLQGYERLMNLYNKFPDRDPDYELRAKFDSKYVEGYMDVKKDRFLENEDEYRQRNVLINHELELEHERTLLACGLLLLLAVVGFSAYYLYQLRREHRETLEQNREYADMLRLLKQQARPSILDTDIARRFHDLSSQDAHPTAEEWQALSSEIDRQHPQLFATLQQQYAEHQPDQTMTEQERHVVGLIVIKCSPLQMSVLMVCTKSNVSNLRRRLYQKLTGHDGSGADLDKYITGMCE
jgi:DNA-binding CsgD family transcriptional regulator